MVKEMQQRDSAPEVEHPHWKWVRVSTEMLAVLGQWSDPVEARIVSDDDDVLELEFRRPL